MPEDELLALLLLAGIPHTARHKLMNGYYSRIDADMHPETIKWIGDNPWWLVQTEWGLVKIGWRKRVINIDWTETKVRAEITKDSVTKEETMVHAWGYAKAIEYLWEWKRHAQRQAWRDANPEEAALQDYRKATGT